MVDHGHVRGHGAVHHGEAGGGAQPGARQAEAIGGKTYAEKFGTKDPDPDRPDGPDADPRRAISWNACTRAQKPHLDVETGARAVVVINLAVQSYREGKMLYWDEKRWKASDRPIKA